jgi:hypothetical protein
MPEVPADMMTFDREPDPIFDDMERLFRRFPPACFDRGGVSIAAIELPDMSVVREKYGRPEWLLLDEEYLGWGVLYFLVRDIPPNEEIIQSGFMSFSLEPRHVPLKKNYPHSEVSVFRDGVHICRSNNNVDLLDPDFHLRWRERIVFASKVISAPS